MVSGVIFVKKGAASQFEEFGGIYFKTLCNFINRNELEGEHLSSRCDSSEERWPSHSVFWFSGSINLTAFLF